MLLQIYVKKVFTNKKCFTVLSSEIADFKDVCCSVGQFLLKVWGICVLHAIVVQSES